VPLNLLGQELLKELRSKKPEKVAKATPRGGIPAALSQIIAYRQSRYTHAGERRGGVAPGGDLRLQLSVEGKKSSLRVTPDHRVHSPR